MRRMNRLNSTAQDIARLIHGYLTKTGQKNSIPYKTITQSWMLDKLGKWYECNISRRALCYNLRILRENGLIKSITRHRRNPETGAFEPRPTLYVMTKALRRAFLKASAYFKHIGWKNLLEKRPKEHDAPATQEFEPTYTPDFAAIRKQLGFQT